MAKLSLSTRLKLFRRDKYICQYCGRKFTEEDFLLSREQLRATNPIAEHVIPRKISHTSAMTNLKTSCQLCNVRKSNLSLEEFRERMLKIIQKKNKRKRKYKFYFEK